MFQLSTYTFHFVEYQISTVLTGGLDATDVLFFVKVLYSRIQDPEPSVSAHQGLRAEGARSLRFHF